MKSMRGFLPAALALGAIAFAPSTASALSYTVFVNNPTNLPTTNDWATVGSTTSNAKFQNFLLTPTVNPSVYDAAGSVVKFGDTLTTSNVAQGANQVGTFDGSNIATVKFRFNLVNGDDTANPVPSFPNDGFEVTGVFKPFNSTFDGTIGYGSTSAPFSKTRVQFTSVNNLAPSGADQITSTLIPASSSPNGVSSLYIYAVVGGQSYDIFLNELQDIPAPGFAPLSISGFIRTADVPEPGTIALAIGSLTMGGGMLVRRRRK